MKARTVRILIVLLWLGATAWLVRFEAFPGWFAHTFSGYRGVFASGPILLDSWMRISFKDRQIGYSHTRVDTNEKDPTEQFVMVNRTVLELNIMGEQQAVTVTTEAALDVLYQLQRFNFVMSSQRYVARVDGRRVGREAFVVNLWTGGQTQRLKIRIPEDAVLYSPFLEMSLSKLSPGQELSVRTIDPATLTPAELLVKAVARERIRVDDAELETTLLVIQLQGMETKAWMDASGRMIRQETPFGWIMEACTPEQAMAYAMEPARAGPDILRAMSVPCKGTIRNPRESRRLRLLVSGLPVPATQLDTGRRQTAVAVDATTAEVTVSAAVVPEPGFSVSDVPADMKPWLASSLFIQADNPEIVRRAQSIVGASRDVRDMTLAIYEWVYRRVDKQPTVSLPSALDVLKNMAGDCNEHTYLFVALARAVGIPAQIRVGLLYNEGAFYYHAWPAVYAGDWWELDPTIGQEAVDATHLSLIEGEFANQLQLLGMIGKLGVEVLEQDDGGRMP